MADAYPAQGVSLRSASAETILLQASDDGRPITIGRIDWASALWMVHPEAIYLHEAQVYRVAELDLEQKVARLQRTESDYYTLPRNETTVELVEKNAEAPAPGAQKALGELLVTRRVVGFQKVRWFTHEVLAIEPLDLPATELLTTGYWIAPDQAVIERLREDRLWRNDPNDYGPGWHALRERVRRRDLYRCQVCGAPETDRTHDVHHKTPFRLFTSVEQANRLENLVTLCPTCHRRAEAAVRVRSGLAGLAYVLGHLAPFMLMCDINDLGVHADPQSPLAEGQPAIAIYDQAPGGVGLSSRLFDLHNDLLRQAADLVKACACVDGCPSCVGPGGASPALSQSSPESGYGGKKETLALLEALISPNAAI
jgi:DEAD/DEAH box helicase domain-containing protein